MPDQIRGNIIAARKKKVCPNFGGSFLDTLCYHWQPEQIRGSGSDAAYLFNYITAHTEILQRIITNKNIKGPPTVMHAYSYSRPLVASADCTSSVLVCVHLVCFFKSLFLFLYCEGGGAHMANWMTQSSAQQTQSCHGYRPSDQTAPHPHTAEEAHQLSVLITLQSNSTLIIYCCDFFHLSLLRKLLLRGLFFLFHSANYGLVFELTHSTVVPTLRGETGRKRELARFFKGVFKRPPGRVFSRCLKVHKDRSFALLLDHISVGIISKAEV